MIHYIIYIKNTCKVYIENDANLLAIYASEFESISDVPEEKS
jgi:hypothetical protein